MGSRLFAMPQVNTRIFRRLFSSKVYDVAIAGGGIMGLATAYFLASRIDGKKICVIEKDPSYTKASTVLSVASIRQQFSLPENVLLSKSTYQFLDQIQSHLSVSSEEEVDIQFKKGGYLFLAGENGLSILQQNYELQRSLDCSISLLTPSELRQKYPWMNAEDVAMASLGTASEGWFDPWLLLTHFKKKIHSLGVKYINGEVTDIETDHHGLVSGIKITSYQDKEDSPYCIPCKYLVNSSGAWAGELSSKLNIYLPVEPRKRNVFVLDCPNGPRFNFAFLVDRSGLYIRYEGGHYITGMSPDAERDTKSNDLTVDYEYFEEIMWPILANRIPAFEKLKVKSAWAGFYDYNTFDQNAIIGFHPVVRNFIFINGFSGHGLQQCAAAGRAVSELILDGKFTTIDLARLGYERILAGKPFKELNVI